MAITPSEHFTTTTNNHMMTKKYQYAVRSKTATSTNDKRCWMNIGTAKLERAAKSGDKYWFVCDIDGHTDVYSTPAANLQEAFKEYDVALMGIKQKQPRYSFYLDYRTGEVFAKVSRNDKDVISQLKKENVSIQVGEGDDVGEEPSFLEAQGIDLIQYKDLSNKGKEIYNIQKLCSLLAEYGFECQRLVNDSEGADVIAHRNGSSSMTWLIQVKTRLTIKKKYLHKNLYIAFPSEHGDGWYIISHDDLVDNILQPATDTPTWKNKGEYSEGRLSRTQKKQLEEYLFKWPDGKQNQ